MGRTAGWGVLAALVWGLGGCADYGMEEQGGVEERGIEAPDATAPDRDQPVTDDQGLL